MKHWHCDDRSSFFLCVFEDYYPYGGFEDVVGVYRHLHSARRKALEYKGLDNVEIWEVSPDLKRKRVYKKGVD